jgi:hypothetical protein
LPRLVTDWPTEAVEDAFRELEHASLRPARSANGNGRKALI